MIPPIPPTDIDGYQKSELVSTSMMIARHLVTKVE